MKTNDRFQLKGRIWIEIEGLTIIGKGKADLLKKTAGLGSLRKAAAELNMSYRQAWYSINQMNKAGKIPLVLLHRGGKKGGIAEITDFGLAVLDIYERSQHIFEEFLLNQTFIINNPGG